MELDMTSPTQSDKTVEELIQERLKVIGDGEWTLLGVPADLVAALTAREERLVQEAVADFISKESIVEKFETLIEYIPRQFQTGYIEGLREEVEEFAKELELLTSHGKESHDDE